MNVPPEEARVDCITPQPHHEGGGLFTPLPPAPPPTTVMDGATPGVNATAPLPVAATDADVTPLPVAAADVTPLPVVTGVTGDDAMSGVNMTTPLPVATTDADVISAVVEGR